MKRNTGFFWFVIITLLLASMACNIPFLGGSEEPTQLPGSTSAVPKNTPVPGATQPKPTETVKPTAKGPNPIPLPLRQGLSSLDTYRLSIHAIASGSGTAEKTDINTVIEVNTKTESNHLKMVTTSVTADDPKPETSVTEQFTIGKKSCQLSSEGGTTKTPTAKISDSDLIASDLGGALSYLVDYNLYVENPTFVAEETLNGVVTNHFKFKVTQLGKDSGAVVKQNSGEYWVAKDGQYLVKYGVVLELDSDKSGTKTVRTELNLELTSINKAVDIAFPSNCTK